MKAVGTKAAEFLPPLPSKRALVRGKVVAGIETHALLCPCGGEGGGDSDSDGGRESGREDSGEERAGPYYHPLDITGYSIASTSPPGRSTEG